MMFMMMMIMMIMMIMEHDFATLHICSLLITLLNWCPLELLPCLYYHLSVSFCIPRGSSDAVFLPSLHT